MADVFDQIASESGKKSSRPPLKTQMRASKGGDVFDQAAKEPAAVNSPNGSPSSPDAFAQDRAITDAWAAKHPYLGPVARFMVHGGQNAASAIADTPGAVYHAVIDPPQPSELVLSPEQRLVYRLGLKQAIDAGQDYASGKVTPRDALSVLPEALGTGVGQVSGGAMYGKLGEVGPELARTGSIPNRIVRTGVATAKDVAGDVPLVRKLGNLQRNWKATAPAPPTPAFRNPGAPYPTATPEQLNPSLASPSRTLPGMNSPEVIRQTAQPIPQRPGLALPPGPEAASPSLVEQMRASAPETQEQMLSRWAARNAATGRSSAPQEPIGPETMTPQEKDIWQQSIFGQEPEKYDPGQISRQQNPEPTRAEVAAGQSSQGPSLLDQIREQVRQIQAQPAEDVAAGPYGRQLRIEGQDVDPNIDLRSAMAESTRRIRAARGLPPLQD
jgi:hypothetical protein